MNFTCNCQRLKKDFRIENGKGWKRKKHVCTCENRSCTPAIAGRVGKLKASNRVYPLGLCKTFNVGFADSNLSSPKTQWEKNPVAVTHLEMKRPEMNSHESPEPRSGQIIEHAASKTAAALTYFCTAPETSLPDF